MLARSIIRCAVVLGLLGAHVTGGVRVGPIEVREGKGGVPCFTIPEAEEQRSGAPDFQSISVAEAGPGPRPVLWSMSMPKPRTFPITFRMCIPYAGRLPVLPQTPAAALLPGRPYDVIIEVRTPQLAGAPRSYRARFCMTGTAPLHVQGLGAGAADPKARPVCSD